MTSRSDKAPVPHRSTSALAQEGERGRGGAVAHRDAILRWVDNGDSDAIAMIAGLRDIRDGGRKAADVVHGVTISVVAVAGA